MVREFEEDGRRKLQEFLEAAGREIREELRQKIKATPGLKWRRRDFLGRKEAVFIGEENIPGDCSIRLYLCKDASIHWVQDGKYRGEIPLEKYARYIDYAEETLVQKRQQIP